MECPGHLQPLIFVGVVDGGFTWECMCLTCKRWTYVTVGVEQHMEWMSEIPKSKEDKSDYEVPGV